MNLDHLSMDQIKTAFHPKVKCGLRHYLNAILSWHLAEITIYFHRCIATP